jgi:hypothetical protein
MFDMIPRRELLWRLGGGLGGIALTGTILSISGQDNGGYTVGGLSGGPYSQVVGASWTQMQSYTNVYIYVDILENVGSDTVNAY